MMNMHAAKAIVVRGAGRTSLVVQKYSPEILLGAGVVGMVASTVLACKATLKADLIVDKAKHKVDRIHYAKKNYPIEEYSEHDYKKDLVVTYVQTGADFAKLYGPSFTLGVLSIGCILGSYGIMKRRNVALVFAYKAVEKSYGDYRKRVIAEFGEDKDRMFKNGIYEEKIEVEETDEKGKVTKVEKVVEKIDPNGLSPYARFFDESSTQWSKTPEYNLIFLRCQQNYANDLLHSRGHIFLNEVYDMIGLPRTQAGAVVGWVQGTGDDYVDFDIFDGEDYKKRDFVNGYERSILLDFNVSGVIYDLI